MSESDRPMHQGPQNVEPPPVVRDVSKSQAWFDLTLVMLVLVIPALNFLIYDMQAYGTMSNFGSDMLGLTTQSVAVVAVCAYIVRHSGLGWEWHGFVKLRPLRDLLLGAGIVAFSYASWFVVSGFFSAVAGHPPDVEDSEAYAFPTFEGGWHWPLMLLGYLANSMSEEGAIRVIATTRLSTITRSPLVGALVANLLFATYHFYQGWLAAIGVFILGLFLSLIFALTRSIWPLVIGHTLANVSVTLAY